MYSSRQKLNDTVNVQGGAQAEFNEWVQVEHPAQADAQPQMQQQVHVDAQPQVNQGPQVNQAQPRVNQGPQVNNGPGNNGNRNNQN